MTTKAQTQALKAAFRRFVELLKPMDGVKYAVAIEPRRPDIFTYIETADSGVMRQVFRAQDIINDEFPDLVIDFHVTFLDGRPLEYFIRPVPELVYERQTVKRKETNVGHRG